MLPIRDGPELADFEGWRQNAALKKLFPNQNRGVRVPWSSSPRCLNPLTK